ncbi:hypothetical protein FD754_012861 [Muntiacus muntjak]|uniref:Histone H2A/H2B/H3 domain-containing protein n=1 Tax=Muntiacus muntjak TaxID=9888 RepID=A0A5N3VFX2_MUNMU|nr:hypothetical protein FD754_012861 [Muntiacus muntjak]
MLKEGYLIYICKVLKQYHGEALHLAYYNKGSIITSREIQVAMHLLLPGELAKNTIFKGTKAIKSTSSN